MWNHVYTHCDIPGTFEALLRGLQDNQNGCYVV